MVTYAIEKHLREKICQSLTTELQAIKTKEDLEKFFYEKEPLFSLLHADELITSDALYKIHTNYANSFNLTPLKYDEIENRLAKLHTEGLIHKYLEPHKATVKRIVNICVPYTQRVKIISVFCYEDPRPQIVIIHRGLSKEIKKELKAHLNEKFPGIDIRFTYPRRIKIARKLGLTKYRRWQIEAGKKFQIS